MHDKILVINTAKNPISEEDMFQQACRFSSGAIDYVTELTREDDLKTVITDLKERLDNCGIENFVEGTTIRINQKDALKAFLKFNQNVIEDCQKRIAAAKTDEDKAFIYNGMTFDLSDIYETLIYDAEDESFISFKGIYGQRYRVKDGYIVFNFTQVFDYHL